MAEPMKWYALMTQGQTEARVKRELLKLARRDDLPVGRVVVARAPVRVRYDGKKKSGSFIEQRKAFPNYLLVQMQYTPDTDHLVSRVKKCGAIGLLPLKPPAGVKKDAKTGRAVSGRITAAERLDREEWKPIPVDADEVGRVLKADAARKVGKKPVEVTVVKGDPVEITGGPYRRMGGEVESVDVSDPANPIITIVVELIGRPVAVAVRWRDVAPLG